MVSKKQRSKQAVRNSNSASTAPNAPAPTATMSKASTLPTSPARTPVRCYCEACEKGFATAGEDSKSPFMRMPREVRDKIYQELLIAKLSPESQKQYEYAKNAEHTPLGEYGREKALDFFEQEICIMPGAEQKFRYRFIPEAMGLLLANKQIHAEASSVLFSENTFFIMPEWERVHTFWRCDRPVCGTPGRPCFVMLHDFLQIKHLYIVVNNGRSLDDPMLKVESARLLANIKNVVACFKEAGIKLKTLKIRYTSCFEGELDAVRDAVDNPPGPGMPERPLMIKDKYGKNWRFSRAEAQAKLFGQCNVLLPFKAWAGIAEDVKVRGEMPQKIIDELTATLSSVDVSVPTMRKKARESATKQARPKVPDPQSFWRKIRDKAVGDGDQGMVDLMERMMRTSVKSPSVMAQLLAPPTRESLQQMGAYGPPPPAPAPPAPPVALFAAATDDKNSAGGVEGAGGIGVFNGMPVFGPARPEA